VESVMSPRLRDRRPAAVDVWSSVQPVDEIGDEATPDAEQRLRTSDCGRCDFLFNVR
jgi:hypothetical protein